VSIASGRPFEMEIRIRARAGDYHWFLSRVSPLFDDDGRLRRWFGTCTRIDDQRAARDRANFLAEVSSALAESLDYDANLQKLARLAVPRFAGFCIVDLVNDDGSLTRVATASTTPENERLLDALRRCFPVVPTSSQPAARALRSRATVLMHFPDDAALAATTRSPEHFELLRRLGPKSAIACPMTVKGRVTSSRSASSSRRRATPKPSCSRRSSRAAPR
jgi:hypothetical protein